MDGKEIQPVHPKWNQSWIFIGRTDDEAETPILWPPDLKNQLSGKAPDAGKDWRQEEKGMTEDEILTRWTWVRVGTRSWWWTRRPGVLQSMGSKRVGATERLNWTYYNIYASIGSVSLENPDSYIRVLFLPVPVTGWGLLLLCFMVSTPSGLRCAISVNQNHSV